MAVGQAPAASILAPAASILAPARILQYFQYTGKRYQYTVLAPLEQPVQHTSEACFDSTEEDGEPGILLRDARGTTSTKVESFYDVELMSEDVTA